MLTETQVVLDSFIKTDCFLQSLFLKVPILDCKDVRLLGNRIVTGFNIAKFIFVVPTSLVVQGSESLTTNHEVPGSIPGSTVGIFLGGEDSRGDHGLGRLVEFRFKAPPGSTSSSIATHTPSGQRNCASWASQPQKSVTLLPCRGGRTTKSTKDMWWGEKKLFHST